MAIKQGGANNHLVNSSSIGYKVLWQEKEQSMEGKEKEVETDL